MKPLKMCWVEYAKANKLKFLNDSFIYIEKTIDMITMH